LVAAALALARRQDRDGTGKIIGHEGATAITKEHAFGLWCAQRATDEAWS